MRCDERTGHALMGKRKVVAHCRLRIDKLRIERLRIDRIRS